MMHIYVWLLILLFEYISAQEIVKVDSFTSIIGSKGGKAVLPDRFEIYFPKGAFKEQTKIKIILDKSKQLEYDTSSYGDTFYPITNIYNSEIRVNFGRNLPVSDSLKICFYIGSFLNQQNKEADVFYSLFVTIYQIDIGPMMQAYNTEINDNTGWACGLFPIWHCVYNLWTQDSTYETVIGFAKMKNESIR